VNCQVPSGLEPLASSQGLWMPSPESPRDCGILDLKGIRLVGLALIVQGADIIHGVCDYILASRKWAALYPQRKACTTRGAAGQQETAWRASSWRHRRGLVSCCPAMRPNLPLASVLLI
jgi:hypothetical protein